MQSPDYSISTPENVDLHLELAGIGNRILATLIDTTNSMVIILLASLALFLLSFFVSQFHILPIPQNTIYMVAAMIAIFIAFFVNFGYNILFEGLWNGQTPGKKIAQIRVIEANGQPVGWAAVCIRNIVRVVDTGLLLIGLLVMLIDKNERRLGDLAAGTLVIRERKSDLTTSDIKLLYDAQSDATLDIGRITPEEYDLLARFLKRRASLSTTHRPVVAKQLETYFREKLAEPVVADEGNKNENTERFLEKVFLSYQARGLE